MNYIKYIVTLLRKLSHINHVELKALISYQPHNQGIKRCRGLILLNFLMAHAYIIISL